MQTIRPEAGFWWERGAATWYYKDDWKGLALKGGRSFHRTFQLGQPAKSAWIVVWGDRGYKLLVNDKLVGENVDGGLIDDYDLTPFVSGSPHITITIEGPRVCAEGELVAEDGSRLFFATGEDWQTDRGQPAGAERMTVGPSQGAYHRAHNGRLLTYNDEERGKTAIATALARIQRLRDQGIFLMRRYRPAEDILSFEPTAPWRNAEARAEPVLNQARTIITDRAIPAQLAGRFAEAQAAAAEATGLIEKAEQSVHDVTAMYRLERQAAHLVNCGSLLLAEKLPVDPAALNELARLAGVARIALQQGKPDVMREALGKAQAAASALTEQLLATALPRKLVTIGALDEFPESPFGWLNARELIGNDPSRWPFSVTPSIAAYIDLAGLWDFRTDPNNEGEKLGWHSTRAVGQGWRTIAVPGLWERAGFMQDNFNSPADAPYQLPDRRTGDKPYNGFAWYTKSLYIPSEWQDKPVVLSIGSVANWARVFINGQPLADGVLNPPREQTVPERLLRFGAQNLIAVQVYNHDNFGGILSGPVAIYVQGVAPDTRETPGPLSYVTERSFATPSGTVRQTLLASALSPGVIVATDQPRLELWGWEAKGHPIPSAASLAITETAQTVKLDAPTVLTQGDLREDWVLLQAPDRDVLIAFGAEAPLRRLAWETNALGSRGLTIEAERSQLRAAIICLPPGTSVDACRLWAAALRRYPVAASEMVMADDAANPLARRHLIAYEYLDLNIAAQLEPISLAPLPMLTSYALRHNHPTVRAGRNLRPTGYESVHAPYLACWPSSTVEYHAPAIDRSKVLKGVGELFAKRTAEQNARGGVSEDEMFNRMGEWGFDHCRYALAFHADWDLPLVKYMGGPIIEDNEALWRRLDELVEKCNNAGMQMMLCWFFNEDSPQRDAAGAVRNSTRYWKLKPETKQNAFELWRRIAQRYADKPPWAISYDFFNEPAYMNTDHWNEIIRELTAVIRAVDKTHMIVWESADGWAQPHWCLWMQPANDPNVLYSFHHYGKHWGYAYDEYYPSYQCTQERTQIDPWLEAILFGIRYNVPIHCGEFGISMIQPGEDGLTWLNDYLAFFERFGIGWNWWNYSGSDIYRTGLAAGNRISPNVAVLRKWIKPRAYSDSGR